MGRSVFLAHRRPSRAHIAQSSKGSMDGPGKFADVSIPQGKTRASSVARSLSEAQLPSVQMVQIMVHLRPGDRVGKPCFEIFECEMDTSIKELKQMIEEYGKTSGKCSVPWTTQELVFAEERCENDKCLRDYGINMPFIKQVTGFVVNPREPGKRFVEGVLVPY